MNWKKITFTLFAATIYIGTKGQVNLQTGAATFSLPIFSYSDGKKLNTAVALTYVDGNGLKVNEVASCVGTGWKLQYGGVIRREQRGLPDDQSRSLILQNPLDPDMLMSIKDYHDKYYPNGYLYTHYKPNDPISNEGGFVKMQSTPNPEFFLMHAPVKEYFAADREQDVFRLDFGQGVVEFVIGYTGPLGSTETIKILNDSKLKIEPVFGNMLEDKIKTRIVKFIVTGLDGMKYVFADKELSRLCSYTVKKAPDDGEYFTDNESGISYFGPGADVQIYTAKRTDNYIVTAWYLSEVLNPYTGRKIEFTYDTYNIDMPGAIILNKTVNNTENNHSMIVTRDVAKQLRIKSIACSPQTKIDFVYNTLDRIDLPGDKALDEILVKENGQLVDKYKLLYGYFFQGSVKPYNFTFQDDKKYLARLCLQSVSKVGRDGATQENPHLFNYFEGTAGDSIDIVPPMHTYWTDHWGYYNANVGGPGVIHRPHNYNPGKYLITRLCTQPSSREPYETLAKNGILKEVVYPMGGTLNFEYEQNEAFHAGQNKPMGGVRVKRSVLYDGNDHAKDIVTAYKYMLSDGTSSSGWGYESPTYATPKASRVFKQSANKYALNTYFEFAYKLLNTSFLLSQGLDIGLKAKADIKIQAIQIAFSFIVSVLADIFSSDWQDYNNKTEYSNTYNEAVNPLPFQYSRVEISNLLSDNSHNGKMVYEFTSPVETPLLVPTLAYPFSSKARYGKWAYGLPKRLAVFDKTDKILTETINTYNVLQTYMSDNLGFMSKKWDAQTTVYDAYPSSHTAYLAEYGNIVEQTYYPLYGHAELTNSKQRIYSRTSNVYTETETNYTYNTNNYQLKSKSSQNSKGEVVEQKFYYPGDYTGITSMNGLVTANMHNTLISSETWIDKGGQKQLLDLAISEFAQTPGTDWQPFKSYGLNAASPLDESVIQPFQTSTLVRNTQYIKENLRNEYDADGNLLNSFDVTGQQYSSKLYDYNNRFVVAEVTNAKNNEVCYTSFESDGKGGWAYNDNFVTEESCPTGKKCYQLTSSNPITRVLTTPLGRDSRLTFWATSPTVNLGPGYAVVRSGPTINGWTYYEFVLDASATTVTIIGNGKIDELRLLPRMARMSTVTYEPGIGKTSVCDASNRIMHYQYDVMGRVRKVLDENANVIKTYEYHQKN